MSRKQKLINKFGSKLCMFFIFVTVCGHILIQALSYSYSTQVQNLEIEIHNIQASMDGLEMKKQELVSFERLEEVATKNGYTYRSDAVATYSTTGNE